MSLAAKGFSPSNAVESAFQSITPEPVAAASLAEVYRATTVDGLAVAVKVQRPGLERKVSLDFFILRKILAFVQTQFNIGSDISRCRLSWMKWARVFSPS